MYTFKFRLYPSKSQKVLIAKHFGSMRFVYNTALANRKSVYAATGKGSTYNKDTKGLPSLKAANPWLCEVNSQSLQQSLRDLDAAYQNAFRRLKRGEKPGFPVFKKKGERDSFRVPQQVRVEAGGRLGRLRILKFKGGIPIRLHRPILGKIRSATISLKAGRYYASILTDWTPPQLPAVTKTVGIDLGVKTLATLSDGTEFRFPKRRSRVKLLQRALARKKKGSRNRNKAKLRLAKAMRKDADQRLDYLHKTTRRIVDENQVIAVESLDVAGMKGKTFGIQTAGLGEFLRQIRYKAERAGRTLIAVDQTFPSTRTCFDCGIIRNKVPLKERNWTCECGSTHDRDLNAARNIKKEGLRLLAI